MKSEKKEVDACRDDVGARPKALFKCINYIHIIIH
jgi:hypothetical protein